MTETGELAQLAIRALSRDPSRPAIEYHKVWHSWGDLSRTADQLRSLLNRAGATPGMSIAFIPRNRPSSIAALLGLIADEHVIGMIYAFQSPAAMAREIERLAPAAVVADSQDMSVEVCTMLAAKGIVAIALDEAGANIVSGFERVSVTGERPHWDSPRIDILTSGTTGPPKQFPISYYLIARYLVGANIMLAGKEGDLGALTPTLLCFPLGNISGIYSTLPPLLRGQRAVLLDKFTVEGWRDHVVRFRPVASGLPPAGVQMVLDADIPAEDLASVKTMGTGAAPLDPTVHRAFEDRYGIPILLSYGATEFGGPVTAMSADLHAIYGQSKFGSVGRAFGGAEIRIVDPMTGDVLPAGQEGLLQVISPRIGRDWIVTSDVGVIDEDGFLFHRGRADGAIMRGGFKVLPETIERALLLHSAVSAAAVTAIADRRLGQVPGAAVQFKPNVATPSSAQLEAHLREHIPATHIPVEWRFVSELPKTPSMKTDRPAVIRLFERGRDDTVSL